MVFAVLAACHANKTADQAETYTCPMHPTVISDRQGTCPVCGMDLVRKARPGQEVAITEDLARLLKSPNETVISSVRTVRGQYRSVPVSAGARGVVTYDTRKIQVIPARVAGRLENIYLKYLYQPVSKGQKIAEIYSPELITAQRELLFLLKNDPENLSLISGARQKLGLLGLSDSRIDDLIRRREAKNTFGVYSPYTGYVITDQQAAASASGAPPDLQEPGVEMTGGMGSAGATTAQKPMPGSGAGPLLREGEYVAAGQTLFTIVSSSALRIELDLAGAYAGTVKAGTGVTLSFGNEDTVSASVDFVQPFFGEGEDFFKVRVYPDKTEGLRIGQLVHARLDLGAREAMWVPEEAVVDLGIYKVIFVKSRGVFKPKQVITGAAAEDMIEIESGLATSEEIAANAHYLVDSESFIRTGG